MPEALQPFGPGIWLVDGGVAEVAGFRYPTRAAVIKLPEGGLFVWSPVALTADLKSKVDVLGAVTCIVAPNSLHYLSVPEWKAAYPAAKVFGAPGLCKRRPEIAIDAELGETAPAAWAGAIDQVVVHGNAITTEVVFLHRASGSVLFTDLIQHFPKGWFKGWRALVAKLDRMTAQEAEVPQKFRVTFRDRKAARAAITRILEWPAEKVLMAHGAPIVSDARRFIRRAFRWLVL